MSGFNNTVQSSRLSEFLAQTGPARLSAPPQTVGRDFTSMLERALAEAGFSPGEYRVTVESSGGRTGGPGPRVTVTFFETAPGRNGAAENGAGEAGQPSYDPSTGPRISRDMWTEAMLTEDLPAELLRNVQDPSELLRARLERLQQPTEAKVVSDYDGSEAPINPSLLSTLAQAEAVRERLINLGLAAGEIQEVEVSGGPFRTEWGGEERRMYTINGLNVGLILEKYARYPKEYADQMMLDEIRLLTAT